MRCQVPGIIGSSMGILWVCLLCEEYLSLGCDALLRAQRGLPGWYTFSLGLRRGRVSNDQILYRLLIDVPRAKARGGWSYRSPNLTIFIHTLRLGDNRVGDSPLSRGWWMTAVEANPGLFFIHFHTAVRVCGWGRGLLHCLGSESPW